MPRRWSKDTRTWAYNYLALRDGEYCQLCQSTPDELTHPLEIDHINERKLESTAANLRLLCKPCNVIRENRSRPSRKAQPDASKAQPSDPMPPATLGNQRFASPSDRLSVSHTPGDSIRMVRQLVDYQTGSAEMQANDHMEVPFRDWLLRKVRERGFISRRDAIDAGAELICDTAPLPGRGF